MDGILNIFQGIAGSDGSDLETYLAALTEHQSFRLKGCKSTEPAVQHITSMLSKPATRPKGLLLLNNYLQQCSAEVLEQKAVLWMTLVLKALNGKESENINNIAYIVFKTLAEKSALVPDLSKAFTSNFLSKIYDSLGTAMPCVYLDALLLVEVCLRLYPGPSGPSRGTIEKFILKFIDSTEEVLVVSSGRCYHFLQQIRGGGVQGISQHDAWMSYQMKLLGSLHGILDIAFANCPEVYDYGVVEERMNIPALQLSDEPVKRATQLSTRFNNLVHYLRLAVRLPFPATKMVASKKILNLISRGISVTCPMLHKNPIFDNLAIEALLPMMQTRLLSFLKTLIMTLESNLAMHHPQILGIVHDTLMWTSSKKSTGHQKPYSVLRSMAYETLTLWCNVMKHGSRCETIIEGIIEQILFDITPFKHAFTLQVISGAKKHMSKKARRQLHKAQNEQSNLAQTHSNPSDSQAKKQILTDERNQEVCTAALICLQDVFLSAACFLKPALVRSTHLKIVKICLLLLAATPKSDELYSHYLCRLNLYNVLESFALALHHLCPPPTPMVMKLVQSAQLRDTNVLVRQNCSRIMVKLENMIHPQREGLIFPPDLREIRNAFHKVGQGRLLAGGLFERDDNNDVDDDNDDNDDDESSDEENELTAAPSVAVEKEVLQCEDSQAEDVVSSSIDLTLDDSVEFITEGQHELKERVEILEVIALPKSPEMTLRVEEEEEDDLEELTESPAANDQMLEESAKIINSSLDKQNDDEPSSPKRPRLDESEPISIEEEKVADVDKEIENNKNETSFEEIAASFVDELN